MGVQEALLHFLDRCLELDPAQRATISELKQMEVCQPKYRKALSWPHITRQLPKPMVK
jgi:serine/threonine protein kinase